MAACKETNFFSYSSIEGRFGEYEQHFRGAGAARVVGEISTRYLAAPLAPERIRASLPAVRLFVSLRNPVEQVYSHYWHLRRQNFHEWRSVRLPASVEEALDRYPALVVEPAAYSRHLERWLQHFRRSQLLVLFYDDIRTRPAAVLRQLYAFVDVDPEFLPPSIDDTGSAVRRGTSPRGPRFERAHATLYAFLSTRVYHPLKRLLGVRRAVWVKEALRLRRIMEVVFLRQGYPTMKPETRAFLSERFGDEITRLERLLDADLSRWRT
jgi:hypothetical protein